MVKKTTIERQKSGFAQIEGALRVWNYTITDFIQMANNNQLSDLNELFQTHFKKIDSAKALIRVYLRFNSQLMNKKKGFIVDSKTSQKISRKQSNIEQFKKLNDLDDYGIKKDNDNNDNGFNEDDFREWNRQILQYYDYNEEHCRQYPNKEEIYEDSSNSAIIGFNLSFERDFLSAIKFLHENPNYFLELAERLRYFWNYRTVFSNHTFDKEMFEIAFTVKYSYTVFNPDNTQRTVITWFRVPYSSDSTKLIEALVNHINDKERLGKKSDDKEFEKTTDYNLIMIRPIIPMRTIRNEFTYRRALRSGIYIFYH